MTNPGKTLQTITHLKEITEKIFFDKQLHEKMGPILYPIVKSHLFEIMNQINDIENKVQMLHFYSQFHGAIFCNTHKTFTREEILYSLNQHDQTLKKITRKLQEHFAIS